MNTTTKEYKCKNCRKYIGVNYSSNITCSKDCEYSRFRQEARKENNLHELRSLIYNIDCVIQQPVSLDQELYNEFNDLANKLDMNGFHKLATKVEIVIRSFSDWGLMNQPDLFNNLNHVLNKVILKILS